MLSGQDTLRSVDNALAEVRLQGQELDQMVQKVSTQLLKLRQAEVDHYRRLASLRLEDLEKGEALTQLDHSDAQVRALLDRRAQELAGLKATFDGLQLQQQALETRRSTREGQLARAREALDQAEAETQKRLAADTEHQRALSRATAADAMAREAETKAEQAEQDRIEKGLPYETDPLFMYLWKRGYGTTEYSAFPLVRYLDSRVASLCRFQSARPNYAMLLEIPIRLREHAQQVRGAADQSIELLRDLEAEAAVRDGVTGRQQTVGHEQQELDGIDTELSALEQQAEAVMQQRAAYAGCEDERSQEILNVLATQFRQRNFENLRREAEATARPEDDIIVHELRDLEYEGQRLEESLAHHKALQARHLQRQRELEQVRRDFKQHHYDGPDSTFSNGDLVGGILREFLRGAAGSADVWGTLRRNQRRRPGRANPDFGSGGFGRGGGVWGSGGGGGGGGGFRTGGGF